MKFEPGFAVCISMALPDLFVVIIEQFTKRDYRLVKTTISGVQITDFKDGKLGN